MSKKVRLYVSVALTLFSLAFALLSAYSVLLDIDYKSIADETIQEGSVLAVAMMESARTFGAFACSALGAFLGFIGNRLCNNSKMRIASVAVVAVNLLLFLLSFIYVLII